jgi:hypothetical protein
MRVTVPPLAQYVFIGWYLVKYRDNLKYLYLASSAAVALRFKCVRCLLVLSIISKHKNRRKVANNASFIRRSLHEMHV